MGDVKQHEFDAYRKRKRTILSVIGVAQLIIASLMFFGFYEYTSRLEARIDRICASMPSLCP